MKKLVILFLAVMMVMVSSVSSQAATLSTQRQKRADKLYRIVRNNWSEYGVYPSICIAQGIAESGLGEHSRGYNWWGISSGGRYYSTLKSGVIGYLKVISLPYYRGAPFAKTAKEHLNIIKKEGR